MERSRRPLILLVVALALCITLACVAAAGGLLLYRFFGLSRSTVGVEPAGPVEVVELAPAPAERAGDAPVNRLVVLSGKGDIYTVRPDGTDRIDLTTDGSDDRVYRQPTWSPAADRVAWSELITGNQGEGSDPSAATARTAIVTSAVDGGSLTRADTGDFVPFYLSWSPDGAHLAALSNWSGGLALRTVEPVDAAQPELLGSGAPYYFSWAPDSTRMLTHVSGERLALLTLGGSESRLDPRPGTFGAPEWSGDGEHLLFVEQEEGGQQLVYAGLDGVAEKTLATGGGGLAFGASPDARRIAYIDTVVDVPLAAFGSLHVVDIQSGEAEQVSETPAVAFFWSPDSGKLAYLTIADDPESGPRASIAPGIARSHIGLWLEWRVWDGSANYRLARFAPSDTFLTDYLRFFDQYVRSMTPWSPDSMAFTFAGTADDGALGVWVQQAQPDGQLERVGDGVFSAWSPR